MLVYLSEVDLPLVAPIPLRSLPYVLNQNCLPLLICTRCHAQDNLMETYAELTSSIILRGREIHLIEVKHCEDAWPGPQLDASKETT